MTVRVRARYVGHRPDPIAVRRVFRDDDGPVGEDLNDKARLVLARSRQLVRVRTGRLLASGRIEAGQSVTGPYRDIKYGVPGITDYVMSEHDGSAAHIIHPRRRKALRFVVGGRVVYARRVRHPGTVGSKFLTRALDVLR